MLTIALLDSIGNTCIWISIRSDLHDLTWILRPGRFHFKILNGQFQIQESVLDCSSLGVRISGSTHSSLCYHSTPGSVVNYLAQKLRLSVYKIWLIFIFCKSLSTGQ